MVSQNGSVEFKLSLRQTGNGWFLSLEHSRVIIIVYTHFHIGGVLYYIAEYLFTTGLLLLLSCFGVFLSALDLKGKQSCLFQHIGRGWAGVVYV